MANAQLEIKIEGTGIIETIKKKIISQFRGYVTYKSKADAAMSYMLETTHDERGKELLLDALNYGAHVLQKEIDDFQNYTGREE